VDENGQVHYTQTQPPAGVQGETIKPPPKVDTEGAVRDLKAREEGFTKRLDDQGKAKEEADKQAGETADKAKFCAELREELRGLQESQRIFTGEGESRRRLSEEERQARIKESQDKLDKDCK
jgi:muconolactone delta-isomerase